MAAVPRTPPEDEYVEEPSMIDRWAARSGRGIMRRREVVQVRGDQGKGTPGVGRERRDAPRSVRVVA